MNYDVDTKRFNKIQKFKNSLAESIEFKDLEKAINRRKSIFFDFFSKLCLWEKTTKMLIITRRLTPS